MKRLGTSTMLGALLGATMFIAPQAALAGATLINAAGTVALGVNDLGQLNREDGNVAVNSPRTGVSFKFADDNLFRDGTSPGCFCEGWGVSFNGTTSGFASEDFFSNGGTSNLSLVGFVSTATTATSNVRLTSAPGLRVTHSFAPSPNAPHALFQATVTIENFTGAAINDVKYVRAMDWDVPPTEFNEYVTIKGTGTTTLLERSTNNGFSSVNPLVESNEIVPGTADVDFTDVGTNDHGAYFRFNFGTIVDSGFVRFSIFYGATESERTALAAIGAEGIELYSLGQSSGTPTSQIDGTPATFIFGFKGVGGVAIEPEPPTGEVPEPASLTILGLGLAGAAALRRRAARKA